MGPKCFPNGALEAPNRFRKPSRSTLGAAQGPSGGRNKFKGAPPQKKKLLLAASSRPAFFDLQEATQRAEGRVYERQRRRWTQPTPSGRRQPKAVPAGPKREKER